MEVLLVMNQDKVKVELGGVSASMLGPLWGRAQLSEKYKSLFYDSKAIDLIAKIDYDFSPFASAADSVAARWIPVQFQFIARAMQFDDKVRMYISEHPRTSVINLGR